MLSVSRNNKVIIPDVCRREFISNGKLTINQVKRCFEFARKMADPNEFGAHNPNAFGGNERRDTDEIFQNAFQGKIAEFAFYNVFKNRVSINEPDMDMWEQGKWEDTDFILEKDHKKYAISLKSTKYSGNLLLLERDRYNENGEYLENAVGGDPIVHDYIFLARVKGIDSKFADNYNDKKLSQIQAEISGYITNKMFRDCIMKNRYIQQGVLIGGKPLKVDNYWFCITELKSPNINN